MELLRENSNADVVKQSKARGVDDYEDDALDIEIEESDDESDGGVYPGIKQEAIKFEDVPEMMMRITLLVWPSGVAYPPWRAEVEARE